MVDYPVPQQRRAAPQFDADLKGRLLWYAADLTQTALTTTEMAQLDWDIYSGTPRPVEAAGGLLILPSGPYTMDAYLLDLVSGDAPEILVTYDEVPNLSTGTWVVTDPVTLTPVANHRTPHVPTPMAAVTGIRFHFAAVAEIGNLHIYGNLDAQTLHAVQVDGVNEFIGSAANFGTGGKNGAMDLSVRMRKRGAGIESYALHFSVQGGDTSVPSIRDQIFVDDGDGVFESINTWPDVLPDGQPTPILTGGLGGIFEVKRFAYVAHDNLRPYTVTVHVSTPDNLLDTSFRIYVGDVDAAVAQPQLWHATPASAVAGDTIGVAIAGGGDTESEFSSAVYLSDGRTVPTKLTTTSWTLVPTGDSTAARTINPVTRVYGPTHVLAEVQLPIDLPRGRYQLLVMSSPGPNAKLSDFQSVRVTRPKALAPSPQDGFRLQATDLSGAVLASNVPYTQIRFTDELSDVGAGNVDLDFSSPFWHESPRPTLTPDYVAEKEFIWQVWEGNSLRFSFLNSISDDSLIGPTLSRKQVAQGEGIASALKWSVIVPPKFPVVPPYYWTFTHARLWQWLTIWAECVRRTHSASIQNRFRPTFTRYTDSAGNTWSDKGYENQQKNGVDMLTLLREHCDSLGLDFHVTPDFQIDVIKSRDTNSAPGTFFGEDHPEVIFRSALLNTKRVLRDRTEVGNWIIAQDDYGEVSLKYDNSSVTAHGQRERYVEAGRSGYLTTRLSRASEDLKWHKDQIVSWTLSVLPYYEDAEGTIFNRVFEDYEVGDWIYVEKGTSGGALVAVQISAITCTVDANGHVQVELTLESLASLRRRKAELQDTNRSSGGGGSGGSLLVLFEDQIVPIKDGVTPPTVYPVKYLPLPNSEIVTIGMRKYMEVDGSGGLAVREFTRTLRRGVHWERTGWEVTILDPSVFDESF